ncbi:MAG: hypothetical protein WCI21_06605 [Alphaproteobacteria bacterium]
MSCTPGPASNASCSWGYRDLAGFDITALTEITAAPCGDGVERMCLTAVLDKTGPRNRDRWAVQFGAGPGVSAVTLSHTLSVVF